MPRAIEDHPVDPSNVQAPVDAAIAQAQRDIELKRRLEEVR